jgi:putative transposase
MFQKEWEYSAKIDARKDTLMSKAKCGKRYSEEQILGILREVETGTSVLEVCRKYGVSENTVYRWKSKFGDMNQEQLRQLKQLEAENARLKRIVAQQALDREALKELLAKNGKP